MWVSRWRGEGAVCQSAAFWCRYQRIAGLLSQYHGIAVIEDAGDFGRFDGGLVFRFRDPDGHITKMGTP